MPFEGITGERMRKALLVTIIFLGLFLAVQVVMGVRSIKYIGTGIAPANTITVSGHGEMFAVPNIATFSFSVVSNKTSVADAQSDATTKANAITKYLKDAGVDEKDIQTSGYSINPQYEYQNAVCGGPIGSNVPSAMYCPPGRQVLKGYEVRQTTTVKARDTKKAGDLLAGVGGKGATEVGELNFTFDKPDIVQSGARDKAIADAKQKAEELAEALDVSLVRVVSFSENGSGYPSPMRAYGLGGAQTMDSKIAAPEISAGQNKVSNDVSITYEIR